MRTPPLPRIQGPGWIVLIGGGEFSFGETREFDEFLLSKLPATNRRIAFLPTASGSNEYAIHLARYFQSLAADVQLSNVPIYRARDSRRGKNLEGILQSGLIYLGGGVTNNFLEVIRTSPVENALRDAVARGTTVAAIGAAAAALGRLAPDMRRAGGALAGLNWIVDSVIEPNFDASNDVELRRLMAYPEVKLGIAIPRAAAIAIGPDGVGDVLGTGSVAVARKPVQ